MSAWRVGGIPVGRWVNRWKGQRWGCGEGLAMAGGWVKRWGCGQAKQTKQPGNEQLEKIYLN